MLVLVLWVAAIALFFNRWGKIRMLEPYQPKFQQQHRQSCTTVDANALQHHSYSKFNIHCQEHGIHQGSCASAIGTSRPRQNSVFVGSNTSLFLNKQDAPRRTKSAFDLQSLVVTEYASRKEEEDDEEEDDEEVEEDDEAEKDEREIEKKSGRSDREQQQQQQQQRHLERLEYETQYLEESRRSDESESSRFLRPLNDTPKFNQRDQAVRRTSVCQFDSLRPQRERGFSVCYFDGRTELATRCAKGDRSPSNLYHQQKSQQKDRASGLWHFDRMDVLAKPSQPCLGRAPLRERRISVCNFLERDEDSARAAPNLQRYKRLSVSNVEKMERVGYVMETRDDGTSVDQQDASSPIRAVHSCRRSPDLALGYKATCV